MPLETHEAQCPYCGEWVEIDIEPLADDQSFIEDCTVCCRPIQYTISTGEEGVQVQAARSE